MHLRLRILEEKSFLRQIYDEWYSALAAAVPQGSHRILELGSGAGFLGRYIPGLITSESFQCRGVRLVLDGQRLPFRDGALRGIVMTNVLHHIPEPRRFFSDAARCVEPGGVIAMVEPWVTTWSRFVYTWLHHESFEPDSTEWNFAPSGPLSGANGALPWIVFGRDRARFERDFPGWRITATTPSMPLRYLMSGGLSMRSLMPGWSFGFWRTFERALGPWMDRCAMFAFIVLRNGAGPDEGGALIDAEAPTQGNTFAALSEKPKNDSSNARSSTSLGATTIT